MVNIALPCFGHWTAFFYGAMLGLAYMVFELPNSWFKRYMGIQSGQKAEKNAWVFMMLDKMDSALGVSLASKILFAMSWADTLMLFFLAVLIHVFFSWLLVITGVKKGF
jgi:CDP-diacylglycerol--serine O-phosphatidyltransferase